MRLVRYHYILVETMGQIDMVVEDAIGDRMGLPGKAGIVAVITLPGIGITKGTAADIGHRMTGIGVPLSQGEQPGEVLGVLLHQ
jgi:hypothetical protein